MKPLKFAIPALILATAGNAGAQSVTAEGGVSVDTEATVGESTGMDAEVTAQGGAETGAETGSDAGTAEGGLTVAAEAGGDANGEGDVQLNEGTEIYARDGVTIGNVAGIVDKAQGLFRVELDEAIEADVPAVVLSTETLTAVDGEVQVPMTGAEFTAALEQVVQQDQNATN